MKIAIIHDHLTNRGGGEQVTLSFAKAFPDAPIFTLAYDELNTYPEFTLFDIRVSVFQKLSKKEKFVKKFFFPLGIIAMKQITISEEYEAILMSTTHCAKYVKIAPNTKVFCYAHNPFRLIWYPNTYKQYTNASRLSQIFFDVLFSILRKIDFQSMNRVNFLLTNSTIVKQRLSEIYTNYKGEIEIIPPPVKLENFYIENIPTKSYYLVVSRLEYYKRVDLVIDAFNKRDTTLIIVGDGIQEKELKKKSNKNIIFLKKVSKEKLAHLYSNAKALIFPQLEDYGITPLEANASGCPVIAFNKGGILDTQIPFINNNENATAILFNEQTEKSLEDAIKTFENVENMFNPFLIRKHAESFSEDEFIKRIQKFINSKKKL